MLHQATCVAIGNRAILIEGPPGCGKSSLALALIDRGAVLVGDDGVDLIRASGTLLASPAPATQGLIEIRNLGLVRLPFAQAVPVALVVVLDAAAPRFIEQPGTAERGGVPLPCVHLFPDSPVLALRAEFALRGFGLAPGQDSDNEPPSL